MAVLTAVAGPATEIFLINKLGLYHYSHATWAGIPTWIPSVYFCGSPAVDNLGRKVKAVLERNQTTDASWHKSNLPCTMCTMDTVYEALNSEQACILLICCYRSPGKQPCTHTGGHYYPSTWQRQCKKLCACFWHRHVICHAMTHTQSNIEFVCDCLCDCHSCTGTLERPVVQTPKNCLQPWDKTFLTWKYCTALCWTLDTLHHKVHCYKSTLHTHTHIKAVQLSSQINWGWPQHLWPLCRDAWSHDILQWCLKSWHKIGGQQQSDVTSAHRCQVCSAATAIQSCWILSTTTHKDSNPDTACAAYISVLLTVKWNLT